MLGTERRVAQWLWVTWKLNPGPGSLGARSEGDSASLSRTEAEGKKEPRDSQPWETLWTTVARTELGLGVRMQLCSTLL